MNDRLCRIALRHMSARLDGTLEPQDDQALTLHLAECPACARHWAQLSDVDALMRLPDAVPLPPLFTEKLLARLPATKTKTIAAPPATDSSQVVAVLASVGGLIGACYLACAVVLAIIGFNHLPFFGGSSASGLGGASFSMLASVLVFVVHILVGVFQVMVRLLWPLIGSTSLVLALCLALGWLYILRNYRGSVVSGIPIPSDTGTISRR